MSFQSRGGIPQTINVKVGSDGQCIRFKTWTASLVMRADAPCTAYWTKQDFDNDENGFVFPGEAPAFEYRVDASVMNLWLRGQGSDSNVTIVYVGRDGF